jgi:hypothetical protein
MALPIMTSGRMMAAPAREISQPAKDVAITLPRLNIAIASEASLMPIPSRLSKVGAPAELVTIIMRAMNEEADPKKNGADSTAGGEELHDRHAARALFVEDEGGARWHGL